MGDRGGGNTLQWERCLCSQLLAPALDGRSRLTPPPHATDLSQRSQTLRPHVPSSRPQRECFLEEAVERCLRDPEAPIRCLTGGRSDLVILRRGEDGQHLWAVHKHDCRAAQPSASH